MARKIYWQTVLKKAVEIGIPVGTAGFAILFIYLSALGVINVTSYSGDSICAGTIEDPCEALINFSVTEDIFIYPVGYDPWGRDTPFYTDEGLESWKMYRSWGTGWREIKLNETCTGTWCGAPDNKGVAYSFVFREGRDYRIKIVAYKTDPTEDVKWGFGPVDPVWYSLSSRKYINKLRNTDVSRLSNEKIGEELSFMSYDVSKKEILIEDVDFNTVLKMRLTSDYIESNLVAGQDIKVADMQLIDWKDGENLIDMIDFYDAKDNYKSVDRDVWFKYGVERIDEGDLHLDYTEWVRFETLDELPHKDIKISMWANTKVRETIEWIPTIKGFKIFQWAEWNTADAVEVGNFTLGVEQEVPYGHTMSSDGYIMHIIGDNPDGISEYNLSIAWNVSTAVYSTFMAGDKLWIQWNGNGSKMYTIGVGVIKTYNCTTPYRIASCSDASDTFNPTEFTGIQSFTFADNGGILYIGSDAVGGTSYSYILSTPYLVSLASVNESTILGHRGSGFFVKSDGDTLWSGDYDNEVNEHNMSTPFNLNSQSLTYELTMPYQYPKSNYLSPDGKIMIVLNYAEDRVHQYELAPPADTTAPLGTINTPFNQSYATNTIIFNLTATDDEGMSNVSYTLNEGADNFTMTNSSTSPADWIATNSTMAEGSLTAIFYVRDISNNLNNSENVTFFIDSLEPAMAFTEPTNITYNAERTNLNYTYVEAHPGDCMWSDDGGAINSTPVTMGINWTGLSSSEGSTMWTLYCNDTFGHSNSTEIAFTIDLTDPEISIVYPNNNTNWTDVNLDVNYTASDDKALFNCWYSNDSYTKNTSLTNCGTNITTVVWSEGKHNVTIWANDTAGNIKNSKISFRIDTTAPTTTATATSPPDGASYTFNTWADGDVKVTMSSTDAGVGVDTTVFPKYCADTDNTCDPNTFISTGVTISTEGTSYIRYNATDKLGNSEAINSQIIKIDTILPDILILTPQNNSNSSNVNLDVNFTRSDTNLEECWYSNDTYSKNASLASGANVTAVVWSEGQHNVTVWCNDSANNENASRISFTIDITVPILNITSPINNTNHTDFNLNVNFTRSDSNLESCWYSNDTYTKNTSLANCGNITDVVWSWAQHNVTIWANDSAGNENFSKITFSVYLVEEDIANREVELGSNVFILTNTTLFGDVMCVDIDHPDYGMNYSCSSDVNISFNISNFRKTTFSDGTSNKILNYTNQSTWNVSHINFSSHQYDEADYLSVNISGIRLPREVIFYKTNTTILDRAFDRVYNGYLIGNKIYENESCDSAGTGICVAENNLTFVNPGSQTIYFYIDDNIGEFNLTLNISGELYGFEFEDLFNNDTFIDWEETTAQLDPSGVIMPPNSSYKMFYFDDFEDDDINDALWTKTDNFSEADAGWSYSGNALEDNGYIQLYTFFADPGKEVASATLPVQLSANKIPLNLWSNDEIMFNLSNAYYGSEDSPFASCVGNLRVYIGDTVIFDDIPVSAENGQVETSSSTVNFNLEKINSTSWKVNITGDEYSKGIFSGGNDERWYNWTTGSWTRNNQNGDDSSGSLDNVFYFSPNYSATTHLKVREEIIDSGGAGNCIQAYQTTKIYYANQTKWKRTNGTVISTSVFDSAGDIADATLTAAGYTNPNEELYAYMSANEGENWEAVTLGVKHSFSYPGKHIKWRFDFLNVSVNYTNLTSILTDVQINTTQSNPSNITIDFGDDKITNYTIGGFLNSTNGSIKVDVSSHDLANSFTSVRSEYDHLYIIPLVIYSDSTGQVNLNSFNLTYNPNPVILNTTSIQNFLGNSSGFVNFSILVGTYEGNITFTDIRYDYTGGNDTINVTVHSPDYSYSNQTDITLWYSRWDYNFVPKFVDYLEFLPDSPTSMNVTPYGQSSNVTYGAILNLTNYGYGGRDANLSIYLNQTLACVNLTMSLSHNKSDGFLINDSWFNIQKLSYLETTNFWMWADYDCSYSPWYTFNPFLYFRQCAENCTCSEEF